MEDETIKRIKILMDYKDMKANAFAKLINFDQSSLSKILNGSRSVPASLKEAILNTLPVRREWLLNGDGPMLSDGQMSKGCPYYNVDFLGGFDPLMNDQTTLPAYFIDYQPYNRDGVLWCNITGHSMEPTIGHGDIIAIKPIEDWRYVNFGEIYAVVTNNDLRTVKMVRKGSDDEHLRLVPVNTKDFDEQEVLKADITHLFKVIGSIKRF